MRRGALAILVLAACACSERTPPAPTPEPALVGSARPAPPTPAASGDPWSAGPPAADVAPPAPTDPLPRPFVWAAEKDGRTLTLVGTIHAGVDAKDRLPLWVWKRLESAVSLAVEADPLDPELTAWTMRAPGTSLREELGEAYWARLVDLMGEKRLALNALSSTAVVATELSGYGSPMRQTVAMDFAILQRAKQLGKAVTFLEEGKVQSEILRAQFSLAALKHLIDRHAKLPDLNQDFFRAYTNGDAEALAETGRQSFAMQVEDAAALERLNAALLVERNRAWLPALEKLHAQGDAVVAVGALHLLGKDSVLEMLAARGYKIRRLSE